MMFAISFVSLTAAVTHVTLYYGRDLRHGFKWWNRDENHETVFKADVHTRMMRDSYKEVPMWWYLVVFAITLVISIVICEVYPIYLPWVGILLFSLGEKGEGGIYECSIHRVITLSR